MKHAYNKSANIIGSYAFHSDINGPSKLPEVMLVNGMASMVSP